VIFAEPWHNLKTKIIQFLVDKLYKRDRAWQCWYDSMLADLQAGRLTDGKLRLLVDAAYPIVPVRRFWHEKMLADLGADRLAGTHNLEIRETWLERTLAEIPAGCRILDAGAGELRYKKFCGHLQYVSQDFGQYDGRGNAEGLQIGTWDSSQIDIVSDIISIPVPDASFDAILCVEVFEHLVEPARAIAEFARILRPGGMLILTAPFCSLTHFAPHYFANGYSRYWYERVLPEHGFAIEELKINGNYFEYLSQELRRLPEVMEMWTSKEWLANEKIAWRTLLNLLANSSQEDRGSWQLLHFGYQVRAIKRGT
jgi:ubiquinone/menaquinone biosynthesis C-methylase UbiE